MAKEEAPLVRNVGSKQQVVRASKSERFRRETELLELRELMKDVRFRRFMFRLLGYTSVFQSIFEQSSKIYHNAGRQDVGHFLMAEITEADEEAYMVMMRDHYRAKRAQIDPDHLTSNGDE
jgi:hypothetical protein